MTNLKRDWLGQKIKHLPDQLAVYTVWLTAAGCGLSLFIPSPVSNITSIRQPEVGTVRSTELIANIAIFYGNGSYITIFQKRQIGTPLYKWLPISCRSGADQWKFAGHRPIFYHWVTQPTSHTILYISGRDSLRHSVVRVLSSVKSMKKLAPYGTAFKPAEIWTCLLIIVPTSCMCRKVAKSGNL